MQPRRIAILLAIAAAVGLSACTITSFPDASVDRPRHVRSTVIESFESFSSSDRAGPQVSFRIRTHQSGCMTLTARDPADGRYVIACNVAVRGNCAEWLPAMLGDLEFVANPPAGVHLVLAHVTPEPTTERGRFVGLASPDAWSAHVVLEMGTFVHGTEDVAETRLEI